jgi:hypothetical protein
MQLLQSVYQHQLMPSSNKSSQMIACIDKACLSQEKSNQDPNPAKPTNIPSTCQENDPMRADDIIPGDGAVNEWPQVLWRHAATEYEEVETRKRSNALPYQLQQWLFDTSSPNITLAERLEKSRWKYENAKNEDGVIVAESDESRGGDFVLESLGGG